MPRGLWDGQQLVRHRAARLCIRIRYLEPSRRHERIEKREVTQSGRVGCPLHENSVLPWGRLGVGR